MLKYKLISLDSVLLTPILAQTNFQMMSLSKLVQFIKYCQKLVLHVFHISLILPKIRFSLFKNNNFTNNNYFGNKF